MEEFTAIYADRGICEISPASDQIGCIRLAAMFYVMPVAMDVETVFHIKLRAVLGCSTGSIRLSNSM
eukprot:1427815-Pleurochrysis_carterae.AAC.2